MISHSFLMKPRTSRCAQELSVSIHGSITANAKRLCGLRCIYNTEDEAKKFIDTLGKTIGLFNP